MQEIVIGSLDVDMTKACNLNCPYCYRTKGPQGDANYSPEHWKTITDEYLDAAVKLFQQFGPKPTEKNPKPQWHVSFYGGEPLLVWDKCKALIARFDAIGANVRYTVVTNGTIGDPEMVKFCQDRNIFVQRSVDGCREAQDITRPGSFDRYEAMTPIWKDFKHTRRFTVTPATVPYLFKSFLYFIEKGFARGGSPMPNFYDANWTDEALAALREEFWKISRAYVRGIKERKPWYMYWISRAAIGQFWRAGSLGCGAGRQLWVLSCDGYIYACHRFASDPPTSDYCFGHVDAVLAGTAKGLAPEVLEKIKLTKSGSFPYERCDSCVAQPSCDAGCYHVNRALTGNIRTPPKIYCTMQIMTAKILRWMDGELRQIDPAWWTRGNFRANDYRRKIQRIVDRWGMRGLDGKNVMAPKRMQRQSACGGNGACGGNCTCGKTANPEPPLYCEGECPQNLSPARGNCYLQAGPYMPMEIGTVNYIQGTEPRQPATAAAATAPVAQADTIDDHIC